MDWNIVLWIVIAILIVLPPKYDPAIRLKEWGAGWDRDEGD